MAQLIGILSVGAFVFTASFIVWWGLKVTMGIRVDEQGEHLGLDKAELGLEAYPEFGQGSQAF
jgi:Amt family ammonium transporter